MDSKPLSQTKKQLPIHEWMAIAVAAGAMFALAFMTRETASCQSGCHAHISDKNSGKISRQQDLGEKPLMITVRVTGAVETPGEIQVENGTRVIDLKGKIVLSASADKRYLNKKRRLKNLETLDIPSRKVKSNQIAERTSCQKDDF